MYSLRLFRKKIFSFTEFEKIKNNGSFTCTTMEKQNVNISTCLKNTWNTKIVVGNLLPPPIYPEASSDSNQLFFICN